MTSEQRCWCTPETPHVLDPGQYTQVLNAGVVHYAKMRGSMRIGRSDVVLGIPRYRRIHRKPGFVGLEHWSEDPGDCYCGHTISHHAAPAFGRGCNREKCECAGFVPTNDATPFVTWHQVGWNEER